MEDILKKAEQARESLIPSKSEAVYQKEYKIYLDWLTRKNVMPKDVTETVFLAYFQELSETYSPNSLWTEWSMLKSMMTIHEKRDITKFNELQAFLKRKSKSYKPKKSAVLSPKDVIRFLKDAPNDIHLLHTVGCFDYGLFWRMQKSGTFEYEDIGYRGPGFRYGSERTGK
ncbi:uncharacterized protein isoform X2 [Leptinotarsa decemlineata]|uniref:uncharacterized protein isoform X2 n=1 Tax=Leptinotarsa decemlineata TaxID=7539 RepID=UPI003D3075D3